MSKAKSLKVLFILLFTGLSFLSCEIDSSDEIYYVRKTNKKIKINGKDSDRAWKGSNELKSFSSPWSDVVIQRTQFKALYDEENLYFLFTVEDDDIIAAQERSGKEQNPLYSDRVELFFSANENMDPYFTLEIDSEGRLFDAAGFKPGKVDVKWDWDKDDIDIASDVSKHAYSVEGRISLSSLKRLELLNTDFIYCGVMRAEYKNDVEVQWITWIDPGTKSPNFHHPKIFGRLVLQ